MPTPSTRILHLFIDVPLEKAYLFACRPENFPQWASGLSTTLHRRGDRWVAETPEGDAEVEFSDENAYGVLDHRVRPPGKPEVYVPLRMVRNGRGTEVEFILFRQPDMDDAAFERDAGLVMADLAALKAILEQRG